MRIDKGNCTRFLLLGIVCRNRSRRYGDMAVPLAGARRGRHTDSGYGGRRRSESHATSEEDRVAKA